MSLEQFLSQERQAYLNGGRLFHSFILSFFLLSHFCLKLKLVFVSIESWKTATHSIAGN